MKSSRDPHLVLIVEDFDETRQMYAQYLNHFGIAVAEAINGFEAVKKAFELQPDVILMDLALPKMDGWEATRRLKAYERTKAIPVIAITGHVHDGAAEGAFAAGCDAFLEKPCPPNKLLATMKRLFKRATTRARKTTRRIRGA
ncbi:MAG: response regulator [Planctomycetes bacterium]|nr:response regulator [Planctomycetota bacterium]MBI3847905.1 response regulator [Planctomycetota bacterium]